jgi:hypothetical protein
MFEKRIPAVFFLNIGFVLLLSGCYSSMHQAQVIDGYSMTFAFRPLHREFVYEGFSFAETDLQANDTIASMALRFGRAPSKKGEQGYSIGILVDWSVSPEVAKTNADIQYSLPFLVRGSYYYQFPKNSFLDVGIGGEYGVFPPIVPLIPYVAISRDLGTRFTLYSEIRTAFPPVVTENVPRNKHTLIVGDNLIVPTLGARFDVSRNFSLLAEASLFPELINCGNVINRIGYGRILPCEYKSPLEVAPVIGVGIVCHGWHGWLRKKPVFDDDGNVITEEEIRTNIQANIKPGKGCFGCLGGCLGGAVVLLLAYAMESLCEGNAPESIFTIGLPIGALTGWAAGGLINVDRDRKQAIELIKARRRQGTEKQSQY